MSSAPPDRTRPEAPARRLFFALWPDDDWRRHAVAVQRGVPGGRPVAVANLHLTLVFLGNVAAGREPCVEAAAASVRGEPFTLSLDRVGWFPRPRVWWLGADIAPAPLVDLVEQLQQALRPCGFEPEGRPFRAHVTLARKVNRRPPPVVPEPFAWAVRDFVLVESLSGPDGVEYRVLARWPLG